MSFRHVRHLRRVRDSWRGAIAMLALGAGAARALPAQGGSRLAIPRARAFAHHAHIRMGYHDASGYGDVELEPMPVSDSLGLSLTALFVFEGHVLHAPPAQVSIALAATGSAPRFGKASSRVLAFELDGKQRVAVGELLQVVDSANGTIRESLARRMSTRDFLRVVNATHVVARLGAVAVPLDDEAMEALRDFASRMDPAAHARALAAAEATTRAGAIDYRAAVYERSDVDVPARRTLILGAPAIPSITDTLGAERVVQYEFIVDTVGRVDPATIHGRHEAADSVFIAALRRAAPMWEFDPARKNGHAVPQRVREQVRFGHPGGE